MFQSWACPSFTIKHPGVRKRVVSLAPSRNGYNSFARWRRTRRRASTDARDSRNTSRAVFARYLSPSVRRTRAPALGSASSRALLARAGAHVSAERAPPAETVHAVSRATTTRDDGFLVGDERHVRRRAERHRARLGLGRRQTLVPRRVGPLRPAGRRQSRGAAPRRGEEAPGGSGLPRTRATHRRRPSPLLEHVQTRHALHRHRQPPRVRVRDHQAEIVDRSQTRIRRRRRVRNPGRPRVSSRARRADDHQRAPSRGDVAPPERTDPRARLRSRSRPGGASVDGRRPRPMAPRPRTMRAPRRRRARGSHATLPRRDGRARERAFDVPRVERARFSHPRVHARG